MTIHATHPFADPDPDPVRRLRGRLGGAVALVTGGDADGRAGLTVTSLMVANGEPARLLLLLDPDSDLAEAFAGTAPAPGGPFRAGTFEDTPWGPRLADSPTWAGVSVESAAEVGWSTLLTCVVEELTVGDDESPLVHRRGRYVRPS